MFGWEPPLDSVPHPVTVAVLPAKSPEELGRQTCTSRALSFSQSHNRSYRDDCSGEGDWTGQLDDGEAVILGVLVVAGVGGPGGRADPLLPVSYTVVVLPHHHLDERRKTVSGSGLTWKLDTSMAQWAAVRTVRSLSKEPPQKGLLELVLTKAT